jgi:hypothetical protein
VQDREGERSAGTQHPVHSAQRTVDIVDIGQTEVADHGVERRIGQLVRSRPVSVYVVNRERCGHLNRLSLVEEGPGHIEPGYRRPAAG